MIAEFGQLGLALAACLALASALTGLSPLRGRLGILADSTLSMVVGQFVFIAFSFAVLVYCFMTDDFSVAYVANHSNSLLPWQYKISAAWGGHEGSFLLWILIMAGWMLALGLRRHSYPARFITRVLGCTSGDGEVAAAPLAFSIRDVAVTPIEPSQGSDPKSVLPGFAEEQDGFASAARPPKLRSIDGNPDAPSRAKGESPKFKVIDGK